MELTEKQFLKEKCPHIWANLNQQAQRNLPEGLRCVAYEKPSEKRAREKAEAVRRNSGTSDAEGRELLQSADNRLSSLIRRTSKSAVGDTYRRDLSGVDTEDKVAELFCEITLVDALGGISNKPPILRPKTKTGKECDVMVVVEGSKLFGESKRFDDTLDGKRSLAKSSSESKPPNTARPRSMDLFSKMKDVHKQFPRDTLNVLFLFHPSFGNTHRYIPQALFGDDSGSDDPSQPSLCNDGLFALNEWQEVSACALARTCNSNGAFSIVKLWKNPSANVFLPDTIAKKLETAA